MNHINTTKQENRQCHNQNLKLECSVGAFGNISSGRNFIVYFAEDRAKDLTYGETLTFTNDKNYMIAKIIKGSIVKKIYAFEFEPILIIKGQSIIYSKENVHSTSGKSSKFKDEANTDIKYPVELSLKELNRLIEIVNNNAKLSTLNTELQVKNRELHKIIAEMKQKDNEKQTLYQLISKKGRLKLLDDLNRYSFCTCK